VILNALSMRYVGSFPMATSFLPCVQAALRRPTARLVSGFPSLNSIVAEFRDSTLTLPAAMSSKFARVALRSRASFNVGVFSDFMSNQTIEKEGRALCAWYPDKSFKAARRNPSLLDRHCDERRCGLDSS